MNRSKKTRRPTGLFLCIEDKGRRVCGRRRAQNISFFFSRMMEPTQISKEIPIIR